MHGPMWHGPCLAEALRDVEPVDAAAFPVPGAHSMWELVLHIGAWAHIAHVRLGGEPWRDVADPDNFPLPSTRRGAREWRAAQKRAITAYESLATSVKRLSPDDLADLVSGHPYTRATMLHGVVEHGVYHVGQIVLLRRALGYAPPA